MKLETHTPDRKLLAQAISEQIHEPVHYNGVPRCTYSIGPVTVERDGAITTDSTEAWNTLMPLFDTYGWLTEAQEQLQADLEAPAAQPEPREETEPDSEPPTGMNLSYSLESFTAAGLTNFLRALYTRQKLINAMMKTELLFIDEELITLLHDSKPDTVEAVCGLLMQEFRVGMVKGIYTDDNRLHIDLRYDPGEDTAWMNHAQLLNRLMETAKSAHHMSGKLIDPEETAMKYFCHSWLIALGFGGPDFKGLRAALLKHLPGYSAFRTTEKMDAHKAKFIERRRAARLAMEANGHEENR